MRGAGGGAVLPAGSLSQRDTAHVLSQRCRPQALGHPQQGFRVSPYIVWVTRGAGLSSLGLSFPIFTAQRGEGHKTVPVSSSEAGEEKPFVTGTGHGFCHHVRGPGPGLPMVLTHEFRSGMGIALPTEKTRRDPDDEIKAGGRGA